MQVQNTNFSLNFTSVNRLMINKSAFSNPDNFSEVEEIIIKQLNNRHLFKFPKNFKELLTSFGITKPFKFKCYLEQPYLTNIFHSAKESGIKNFSEISNFVKEKTIPAFNEKYHTFYLFTKDEKNNVRKFFSLANLSPKFFEIVKESNNRVFDGIIDGAYKNLLGFVKYNNYLSNQINSLINNANVNNFIIDDLKNFPKTVKQIDF